MIFHLIKPFLVSWIKAPQLDTCVRVAKVRHACINAPPLEK